LAGNRAVVLNAETLLDVTYQAQIVPCWIVHPDFSVHHIWNPGLMRQSTMRRGRRPLNLP
jgi:hypothetical protein